MDRSEAATRIYMAISEPDDLIEKMKSAGACVGDILFIGALVEAVKALSSKQHDDKGLMLCGCGGEAVRYGRNLFNKFTTGCSECGTLSWSEFSQDEADKSWNNAMSCEHNWARQ